MIEQIYALDSDIPYLTLLTLSCQGWSGDLRFVNNSVDITSNNLLFKRFPFKITYPQDDGETIKEINIEFDNVSLELIDEIRTATGSSILIKIQNILASRPNEILQEFSELKILSANYNRFILSCKIGLDDFLNVELTSEKYTPSNFAGIF